MSSIVVEKLGVEMTHKVKKCNRCSRIAGILIKKPLSDFGKHASTSTGLRGNCRECERVNSKAQRRNPEYIAKEKARVLRQRDRLLEYKKQYYRKNKNKYRAVSRAIYAVHRERIIARSAAWRQSHPEVSAYFTRLRQSRKLKATPSWLSNEHRRQIKDLYQRARELTQRTGIKHVVDHIVPLNGKQYINDVLIEVRGLHVPWNLQILTYANNAQKSNKFLGEMK